MRPFSVEKGYVMGPTFMALIGGNTAPFSKPFGAGCEMINTIGVDGKPFVVFILYKADLFTALPAHSQKEHLTISDSKRSPDSRAAYRIVHFARARVCACTGAICSRLLATPPQRT